MKTEIQIPARIIQTAPTRDLTPADRAAAASLRLHHPGWEYLFFDDTDIEDFVAMEFPEHRATFDDFPHAVQRSDFFRYLAIYRLGGFYVDLDVILETSLEDLRPLAAVFPFEEISLNQHLRDAHGIDWEVGNYAFGATAGHPFLAAVIRNCVHSRNSPSWREPMFRGIPRWVRSDFDVLNTTGPGLLTRTFAENPEACADVTVLQPVPDCDVCDPANWHRVGRHGVHLMAGTWRPRQGRVRRGLKLAWETQLRNRLLARSRALGPVRHFQRPVES